MRTYSILCKLIYYESTGILWFMNTFFYAFKHNYTIFISVLTQINLKLQNKYHICLNFLN